MENTYWRKQDPSNPLFPELIWSRPEHKASAGKLLIIGGNLYAFSAPAAAFTFAQQAGAGTIRVILPDALAKTVGRMIENGEFAPSTPSGSFAKKALAEWLDLAKWSDGVLLAGDFGKNSETAILIENFIQKTTAPLIITGDTVNAILTNPSLVASSAQVLLVMNFSQLQKLTTALQHETAFTSEMDILNFSETLHEFSKLYPAKLMVDYQKTIFCAVNGLITSTSTSNPAEDWSVSAAAKAAVWWIQNPNKPLEAITTSLV